MDIATTLSAISSAKEFASLIISRKIDTAVTEKAIELQNSIIGLQSAILGLQGENQTLTHENHSLKEAMERISNWEREAAQFELTKIAEGVYVYEVKDKSTSAVSPWLCVSCFESRKRGILQRIAQDYGGTRYRCSSCKGEIYDHEDCAQVRGF